MANFQEGRVKFEYTTEEGGAQRTVELPMRTLVVGDFAAGMSAEARKSFDERGIYDLAPGKMADLMEKMDIKLDLEVDDHLHEGGTTNVSLSIRSLADFTPDKIVQSVDDLREVMELREKLDEIRKLNAGPHKKTFRELLKAMGEALGQESG